MAEPEPTESVSSDRPPQDGRRPLVAVNDVLDGKYRLLRPLRRGSMGAVFAAENLRLNVPVAVKVVRADVSPGSKKGLAKRMVQEAHAAFQMDHPAILRMLDVGTTVHGDPYVVMEMLRGETLGAALKERGRVAAAQAIRVLMPIAHALVTAHACKVVHRDVKPSNVFLARTSDGRIQPKLIDFGLARSVNPARARVTHESITMGSPAYMAPEQLRGGDVTGQADVWGFCVTLFEMITGETPFGAEGLEELFARILFEAPRSLREFGSHDEKLWPIIDKGLRKDLDQRWSDMRELGAALAEWLQDRGYGEDVCGASLQATWLEPLRASAKFDVLATAPILLTRQVSRPRAQSLQRDEPTPDDEGTPPAVRRRRSWWWWVALLLLVAVAAVVLARLYDVTFSQLSDRWSKLESEPTDTPSSGRSSRCSW